jgi:CBS domain containing-hemolysin-like protein
MFVQTTIRLFVDTHPKSTITMNQLGILLESSRQQGLINDDESQLLIEILKITHLKVRHVMLPRVEMPTCSLDCSAQQIQETMLQNRINKIPVYTSNIDHVVGVIHLHDLILTPDQPVKSMVHKVHFVPEQKTVESLIDFFRRTHSDQAVVVDEYGGVAGLVELEDITERLLGPMEDSVENEPIEQIGPLQYRLHANLSITDWGQAFGTEVTESRLTTIGGFVTALLEKIPQQGDSVVFGNMRFTVEKVQNNRICAILLSLEPLVDTKEEVENK